MLCNSLSSQARGFYLGDHFIHPALALAPMAGITDLPFRRICKRFGAGLMVTEMIASRAIDAKRKRTELMAEIGEDEHPIGIQIAGSDINYMQDAACWAADHGADFVDINMGCPVKKICKQQAGSALLRNEPLVGKILKAVVGAVSVPVSLKIRTGWDDGHKNVERIARIAEESGIAMLTVHGRTRSQMFHGKADWSDIGCAKAAVSIPVVGNGDVVDTVSAREMLRVSHCDGIMVGRAVQGNPWVLAEVRAALEGSEPPSSPTACQRWQVVREHMHALADHYGTITASQLVRKHVIWYSRGLPGAAEFRHRFQSLPDWQSQLTQAGQFFTSSGERGLAHAA